MSSLSATSGSVGAPGSNPWSDPAQFKLLAHPPSRTSISWDTRIARRARNLVLGKPQKPPTGDGGTPSLYRSGRLLASFHPRFGVMKQPLMSHASRFS